MEADYSQMDKEDVLDCIYLHRRYAIDRDDTSWNIREEHWREIDKLLDRFNELVMLEVVVS